MVINTPVLLPFQMPSYSEDSADTFGSHTKKQGRIIDRSAIIDFFIFDNSLRLTAQFPDSFVIDDLPTNLIILAHIEYSIF